MSHETQEVPRIIDPGAEGWAAEPKVTQAEILLYGDLAGPVRLLGQAAAAAGDAYSLICKRASEAYTDTSEAELKIHVTEAWQVYEAAQEALSTVAERAVAFHREAFHGTRKVPAAIR